MKILVLVIVLFAAATSYSQPVPGACAEFNKAVAAGTAPLKLKKFIDAQWAYNMRSFPERATYVGFPGQDDRWTDLSLDAIAQRKQVERCQLKALNKIPRAPLRGEEQVNFDLLKLRLELGIESQQFPDEFLVLDHLGGIHMRLPDIMESAPKGAKKNYEDRIARLEKAPVLVAQVEALLREGSRRKVTPIKMFLERVPAQFDIVLTAKPEDSPLYKPFKQIQAPISDSEKAELAKRALAVITTQIYPALQKLRAYLVAEYIPTARTAIAWSEMPNGPAWYAFHVKWRTTTKRTPEELHQLGLSEVARISSEMANIRAQLKFKGDRQAFNQFLLTDKQFFFADKDALLVAFRDIAKRIDPELTKLFKTLPRLPYGVRAMPDYKAKDSPAAYYEGGSADSGRPAYFTANTYDLPSRYKWGMETLTLHEAVPGHHLQISLAKELSGLPKFRREGGYTAFIEGWALYAESLGFEMGFFKDPYSHYGHLAAESLRACRLVIDTGLHTKGWTRDQGIQYFLDNSVMSRHEAEVEVDRYLTWPAQALAYKVGQLKFRELRNLAAKELGDKFNVRSFHDEVLKHGALPLEVLEASTKNWIAAEKKKKL